VTSAGAHVDLVPMQSHPWLARASFIRDTRAIEHLCFFSLWAELIDSWPCYDYSPCLMVRTVAQMGLWTWREVKGPHSPSSSLSLDPGLGNPLPEGPSLQQLERH
jgi:hypothetical protein